MPMNPIGPEIETAAPVASDPLRNAARWCPRHVDAAAFRVRPEAEKIQRPGEPGKCGERGDNNGNAEMSGL